MNKLLIAILAITLAASALGAGSSANASSAEAAPLIKNNFSASQVNQFILINCQSENCMTAIKQILSDLSWVEAIEPLGALEEIENETLSVSVEAMAEDSAPVPQAESIESGAPKTAEPAVSAAPITIIPVISEESTVVETETNSSAVEQPAPPTLWPEKSIRINEILSAPAAGQSEWVELYNTTNQVVDLTDWILEEGAGRQTKLFGAIQPQGYLIFDKNNLNNDGDIILLKDSAARIIDQISYGVWEDGNQADNAPAAATDHSIILFQSEYKETEQPTPTAENLLLTTVAPTEVPTVALASSSSSSSASASVATPPIPSTTAITTPSAAVSPPTSPAYQLSDQARVNEFLANPGGSDDNEWIELYNSGDQPVNLTGWTLDDAEGGSAPYKIKDNITIPAQGYLVFGKEETGLSLNNTSDRVALIDPTGKIVSSVNYQNVVENESWAFFDSGWQGTGVLTPATENKLPEDPVMVASSVLPTEVELETALPMVDEYKSVSLKQFALQPLKDKVQIEGVVSVAPGILGKQILYVTAPNSANGGVQVYFYKAEWPALNPGDQVQIRGAVSESQGERRLTVSAAEDIRILDESGDLNPLKITSTGVREENEGSFVQIEGELVQKDKSRLIFSDAEAEFVVYVKTGTGINASLLNVGERFRVTGVVSQYQDEYRIMPRAQTDLENLTLAQKESVGAPLAGITFVDPGRQEKKIFWVLAILLAGLGLINGFVLWRNKDFLIKLRGWFDKLKTRLIKREANHPCGGQ